MKTHLANYARDPAGLTSYCSRKYDAAKDSPPMVDLAPAWMNLHPPDKCRECDRVRAELIAIAAKKAATATLPVGLPWSTKFDPEAECAACGSRKMKDGKTGNMFCRRCKAEKEQARIEKLKKKAGA